MKISSGGVIKKSGQYFSSEVLLSYTIEDDDLDSSNEVLSDKFNKFAKEIQYQRYKSVMRELYKTGMITQKEMLENVIRYVEKDEKSSLLLESKKFNDKIKELRNGK